MAKQQGSHEYQPLDEVDKSLDNIGKVARQHRDNPQTGIIDLEKAIHDEVDGMSFQADKAELLSSLFIMAHEGAVNAKNERQETRAMVLFLATQNESRDSFPREHAAKLEEVKRLMEQKASGVSESKKDISTVMIEAVEHQYSVTSKSQDEAKALGAKMRAAGVAEESTRTSIPRARTKDRGAQAARGA